MSKVLSRRRFLRGMGLAAAGAVAAACQPKTIIVEKEVPKEVTKIVKETVVVEGKEVEVTKVVKETVVVEKVVTQIVEKAPEAEPIELIVQHAHPVHVQLGEEWRDPDFEEQHPGVTIKREFTPGYVTEFYPKLVTMHAGGTPWDVAELPSWQGMLYQLYAKGVFKALEPFVDATAYDLEGFFPVAVEAAKFRGSTLFMIPLILDPGLACMVYNKDLLAKAEVPEPTHEWRYDEEWEDALKKAKEKLGDEAWTWSPPLTSSFGYQTMLNGWKGRTLDEEGRTVVFCEDEKTTAAMKFHYDLYFTGVIPKAGDMPGGNNQMFIGGQLVFITAWTPLTMRLQTQVEDFEPGFTLMPRGPAPDGVNGSVANYHFVGMSANTKHPDMSWNYVMWYTGEEVAQRSFDASGMMSARRAVWNKPENQAVNKAVELSAGLLETMPLPQLPWNFRGREMEDVLRNNMDKAWLGESDLESAMAATCQAIQEVLDKPIS